MVLSTRVLQSALLFLLLRCLLATADPESEMLFAATECGRLLPLLDSMDSSIMKKLLPKSHFFKNFVNRSVNDNAVLVDVDQHSWILLANQLEGLKRSNTKQVVYAIAYDDQTCSHLQYDNVICYYDAEWATQMRESYVRFSHDRRGFKIMHAVMFSRMVTSMVMVCSGLNVFLTDTDVVLFRDPLNYALHNADIMITATEIVPENARWGGKYFVTMPEKYFTLNNGVVYFKSTEVVRNFLFSLVIYSINSLRGGADYEVGFLQTTFNGLMNEYGLFLHPYR
jgi:hypothetical protein